MKKLAIKLIRFYQKRISPKIAPMCKFYPSCSNYAIVAIERFGFFRGSLMAIWRLIRCSPLTSGGYDPVPEKKEKKEFNGEK